MECDYLITALKNNTSVNIFRFTVTPTSHFTTFNHPISVCFVPNCIITNLAFSAVHTYLPTCLPFPDLCGCLQARVQQVCFA